MTYLFAPHRVPSNTAHYASVRAEMTTRGAPTLRAVWCESHGAWLAIEGSHRIAAAVELGLDVSIEDVTGCAALEHDIQDVESPCSAADLADWLLDTSRLNASLAIDCDAPRGRTAYETTLAA